jgi:hypothetical protein
MKRYQVFVSSSFEDLVDERRLAALALINHGYLPSGMEMFAATPGEIWPYIEAAIRHSDYYVLLLKERYGSIADGLDVSWTHREYNYARSLGKPIIAFLYRSSNARFDPPLVAFREEVMKERLVRFWNDAQDLTVAMLGSVQEAVQHYPAPGWIRTDSFGDEEESMLSYYRRSADYDFAPFIRSPGEIKILLNDGYSWVRRNEDCLRERFLKQPNDPTLVVHVAEDTPLLARLAKKSAKTTKEQRADILELRARLRCMADEAGYKKLEIYGHHTANTHCLFLCHDHVIVTTYFTSNNRFLHLPLYKFRSGTSIYSDFMLDFDMIYREARFLAERSK